MDDKKLQQMIKESVSQKIAQKIFNKINEAGEPTVVSRSGVQKPTKPTDDDKLDPQKKWDQDREKRRAIYRNKPNFDDDKENLTDPGVAALKMYNIWNSVATQYSNFDKGKELSSVLANEIEAKTGLPSDKMYPIVHSVMRVVIDEMLDSAESEVDDVMPGVLELSKS